MQSSGTANLIFSVVEIIEYLSKGMTLYAGDVIATGTPGGVGGSATHGATCRRATRSKSASPGWARFGTR